MTVLAALAALAALGPEALVQLEALEALAALVALAELLKAPLVMPAAPAQLKAVLERPLQVELTRSRLPASKLQGKFLQAGPQMPRELTLRAEELAALANKP